MITIIEEHNAGKHADLLASMFALRARVFRDKLGWDVSVDVNGEERDKFDLWAGAAKPAYIVAHTPSFGVVGTVRLLPTTGPTLFQECFADTAHNAAGLSHPALWEMSRFCADHPSAALDVLAAVGKLALRTGFDSIIGNMHMNTIKFCRYIGLMVAILGETDRFGHRVYLGLVPVGDAARAAVAREIKRRNLVSTA